MSYIDDLNQAAQEALAASSSATNSAQIMSDVANGGEDTTVTTAGGEVKSLAKAIKDIVDAIEAGAEETKVEPQTLSEGQTTVTLSTFTTEGVSVYVEGSREFDFTVVNSTDLEFGQSFPEGTRIWVVKRDIEGFVSLEESFETSMEGWEERFNELLANTGYIGTGVDGAYEDYASGIEITEYNQVVRDSSGEFWRASGSTVLPYTTTGTGLPESGAFVSVGDAALRQDLAGEPANGAGALKVRGAVIYVDTIEDLQALPTAGLVDGQAVTVRDVSSHYTFDLSSTKTPNGVTTIAVDGERVFTLSAGVIWDSCEILIPTDYSDIQSAINALCVFTRNNEVVVDLYYEAGHIIGSPASLQDGDFRHFQISSADSQVAVAGDFPLSGYSGVWLRGQRCGMPRLNCIIDMNSRGAGGIFCESGSTLKVNSGCGVINCADDNLYAWNSVVDAELTVWDGAGNRGVRIGNGGVGRLRTATAKNCSNTGLAIAGASVCLAQNGDFSGSFNGVTVSSAASLHGEGIVANDCGGVGVVVSDSANANLNNGEILRAGNFALTVVGAVASFVSGNASTINATLFAISADGGGVINAKGASAGSDQEAAVRAISGANINFDGGTATSNVADQISIFRGATISAFDAVGNFNRTTNELSRHGVIYN